MLYCFDHMLPFDYSKFEMELSQINNNGILYNQQLKKFTDFEGNEINISGELIFPRTGATQIYEMNDDIIAKNGIPIISNNEIDMIEKWPMYCETERKIRILKGKDLVDPSILIELENAYGSEVFIKTKKKNFSNIIPLRLLQDSDCAFYKAMCHHLDEDFIISEKIDIKEDEYGKKEYRCFIIDNQVYNISRFTVNVLHKIDRNVLEKAETIVKSLKGKLPGHYVLDLFEYQKGDLSYIDVAEINPIHASGLYLYNSAMEKSCDLLHSNLENVSSEFSGKIDECSIYGTVINDRDSLYEVRNSFAGDFRSICLTGDIGLIFSDYTPSVKIFARHAEIYNFNNMKPISDEEFFMSDEDFFEDCKSEGLPEDAIEQLQKLLKLNRNN